ncbi:MAG: PspC domain-containing protein [Propionibacteriaceae bacterium]
MTNTPMLHRSTADAKIAGVCGGLAARLNVDPLLIRVVAIVLTFAAGTGAVFYAMAWLAVPADNDSRSLITKAIPVTERIPLMVWAAFALAGTVFIAGKLTLAPAIIIAAIVWAGEHHRRKQLPSSNVAPQLNQLTPFQQLSLAWEARLAQVYQHAGTQPTTMEQLSSQWEARLSQVYQQSAPVAVVTAPKLHRYRPWSYGSLSIWGSCALGISIIIGGSFLGQARHWWTASHSVMLGASTIIIGLGIIASAIVGRSRMTVLAPIALLLCLGFWAPGHQYLLNVSIGVLDANYHSAAEIPSTLRLGSGPLTVDFDQMELPQDHTLTIAHGAGPVVLTIPANLNVAVTYDIKAGVITAPGLDKTGSPQGNWAHHVNDGHTLTIILTQQAGPVEIEVK